MFDSKSDYALNKLDPDAIVCPSATGVHIRLPREDFASEYQFQHWKAVNRRYYRQKLAIEYAAGTDKPGGSSVNNNQSQKKICVDGHEVSISFTDTKNTVVINQVKQILLAFFISNTSKPQPSGILAI